MILRILKKWLSTEVTLHSKVGGESEGCHWNHWVWEHIIVDVCWGPGSCCSCCHNGCLTHQADDWTLEHVVQLSPLLLLFFDPHYADWNWNSAVVKLHVTITLKTAKSLSWLPFYVSALINGTQFSSRILAARTFGKYSYLCGTEGMLEGDKNGLWVKLTKSWCICSSGEKMKGL